MNFSIEAKKIPIFFISVFLSLIFFFYIDNYSYNSFWLSEITIFIVLLFSVLFCLFSRTIPSKRLFIYIFFLLTFVFHFSHIILEAINYDFGTNTRNNVFFRHDDFTVFMATKRGLIACIGLFLGITTYYTFFKNKLPSPSKQTTFPNRNLAYILIIIGVISDFSRYLNLIIEMYSGGYASVQASIVDSFYGYRLLSYLLLPGILLLILDKRRSIQKRKHILYAFILYKFLLMFSGGRAYCLLNIILAVYVFYKYNDLLKIRFNIKTVFLCFLLIQFIGGGLIGIREARTTGMELSTVIEHMFDLKSNIVLNLMSEFGITENVLCVIEKNFQGISHNGVQLLYSFLIIIPGISMIAPNLDYKNAFLESNLDIHNYGGSFIGDMLYDFGENGVLLACFMCGLFFSKLYEWYEKQIDLKNYLSVALFSPIIIDFLFCIRSSLAKMPRMISWYVLIFMFFLILSKLHSFKRN